MAAAAGVSLARSAEKSLEKSADEAAISADSSAQKEAANEALWKPVLGLSCELTVDLPMPDFKISDLLKLHKDSVIDAHWKVGRDVPLRLNATLIGWIEFEVVAGHLAVRMTELA